MNPIWLSIQWNYRDQTWKCIWLHQHEWVWYNLHPEDALGSIIPLCHGIMLKKKKKADNRTLQGWKTAGKDLSKLDPWKQTYLGRPYYFYMMLPVPQLKECGIGDFLWSISPYSIISHAGTLHRVSIQWGICLPRNAEIPWNQRRQPNIVHHWSRRTGWEQQILHSPLQASICQPSYLPTNGYRQAHDNDWPQPACNT